MINTISVRRVLVSSGQYTTEYSSDETVMRVGSVGPGARVLLVDDLIATGGTAIAGISLVREQFGAFAFSPFF